jgi:NADPH-dependent ferric siderophore reductase
MTILDARPETAPIPFRLFAVTVKRVVAISPTYRRITFTGPLCDGIADNRHDQRIKFLLPTDGMALEEFGLEPTDWYQRWRELPDDKRMPMRTYTIREVRSELAEFDVDVALHGRIGPASSWALDAQPGDSILVNAPCAHYPDVHGGVDWHAPERVDRVLLAGDETAAPAIAGILERLPADACGVAVIEVPHAADAAVIGAKPEHVEVVVLARGDAPVGTLLEPELRSRAPQILEECELIARAERIAHATLEDVDIDAGLLWEVPVSETGGAALGERAPFYAWLAGEASVIKTLRRLLVSELGVDRRSVAFMGYWREGRPELGG